MRSEAAGAPFPEKDAFVCSRNCRCAGFTPSTLQKPEEVSRRANGRRQECRTMRRTASRFVASCAVPSNSPPFMARHSRTMRSWKSSRSSGSGGSGGCSSGEEDRPAKMSVSSSGPSWSRASTQSSNQPERGRRIAADACCPSADAPSSALPSAVPYEARMLRSSVSTELTSSRTPSCHPSPGTSARSDLRSLSMAEAREERRKYFDTLAFSDYCCKL